MSSNILVIPDPQIRDGVDLRHLAAAGKLIVERKPDVIVFIGDIDDMPSLSSYNTNIEKEGLRIKNDMASAIKGMNILLKPLHDYNKQQALKKRKRYNPRLVLTDGNHSSKVRIERFEASHPEVEGLIEPINWENWGIEVYPFLTPVEIEGIWFCHYFTNPLSLKGNPVSGTIDNCIKALGFSFCMGHQQGLKMGKHYLGNGVVRVGVIAGSFYLHDESYMNNQSNHHWRGVVLLNNASKGDADLEEIGIKSLMQRYKR